VYALLKDGIPVSVPDAAHGGQKIERLRVIDRSTPENNDFLLVSHLGITGALYTGRPDLIGFVNGLPWVVIELTCSPRWRRRWSSTAPSQVASALCVTRRNW
jgi:type I restriction enzyme R subunit